MKIPKEIKELVRDLALKDAKRKKEMQRDKEESERIKIKKQQQENLKADSKLYISQDIFSWRDEFLKTFEGKQMFKLCPGKLEVFASQSHGHRLGHKSGYGYWSRFQIIEEGFEYMHGYKWMPAANIVFKTPEDLANSLNSDYLSLINNSLKNEKIFEKIIKYNGLLLE